MQGLPLFPPGAAVWLPGTGQRVRDMLTPPVVPPALPLTSQILIISPLPAPGGPQPPWSSIGPQTDSP